MLFDLRGSGRRRTIKVIYASLAILMGGSLVLLGVGSDTQGGLLDAFSDENSGGSDGSKELRERIERQEARLAAAPRSAAGWAQLTRLRFQLANQDGYDSEQSQQTGQAIYTDGGKRTLRAADQAWQRYLALDPPDPDPSIAQLMVQAYDGGGLADFAKAVTAQEIVIDGREADTNQQRSNQLTTLALLAYQAEQDQKGDLAANRAVQLAPEDDRKELRENIDEAKTQILQARTQGAAPSDPTAPSG